MTDPVIPPKIVQDAARALRSGEHLIAEVLAAVLVDLRAAGWSVCHPGMTGKTFTDEYGEYILLRWPRELPVPFFEGQEGSYTIAPWSVKLTPPPKRPAESEGMAALEEAVVGRPDLEILPVRAETAREMFRLIRRGGTAGDPAAATVLPPAPSLRWGWSERHAGIPPSEPAEKSPPDLERPPRVGDVVIFGKLPAIVVEVDCSPPWSALSPGLTLNVFFPNGPPMCASSVPRGSWRHRDVSASPTQKG